MNLSEVEREVNTADLCGIIRPVGCKARCSVAIIIAFRDREQHLAIFLRHMHPFLQRQLIMARIFVMQMVSTFI